MNSQLSVLRRLADYALLYKFKISLALLILIASVVAQLAGPLIAKVIIDQHILAIELDWYEVDHHDGVSGVHSVAFRGNDYIRQDWIHPQQLDPNWTKVKVAQRGSDFYLTEAARSQADGANELADSTDSIDSIDSADSTDSTAGLKLSATEVMDFYQHDVQPVLLLVGLFIALLLAASVLTFTQGYLLQVIALQIIQKMRMDVMGRIHRISVRYFDNTPVGQVVSRLANDTEAIKELFMSFMATFVVSGVNLLGIFVALFILDKRLALLCLLILPLFVIIMKIHLKYSKVYIAIMRARLADMNAMLSEMISVMPIIQAFRREKEANEEFEQLNHDRYVNNLKQFRIFSLSSRNITTLIESLTVAMVIWYFGGTSLQTMISFGVFYAFLDYLGRLFPPIIGIFEQLTNAQSAYVSAERVFTLMDNEGEDIEPAPQVQRPEGHVKFDHVSFAYKDEDYVLRDISFEAKKGETIALVGHTGSGKSSIMNLLLGFYENRIGTITIDGKDIRSMSKQSLRKHMGVVLQDPFLFAGDVKFNVSLYDQSIDLARVKAALKDVGAEAFVQQLPQGYDEPVVERGSTLSAGQRQLISFARALAFNPAILILDEATASVDSETEGTIQAALQVLCEGRTTFIIAHRLSTIKEADRILVLHRGEIVESGNHEELMQQQGRYYRMYQLQKGGTDHQVS